MKSTTLAVALAGMSISLVACGGSPTPRTYADATAHFSVTAPAGWTAQTLDAATRDSIVQAIDSNPELAPEAAAVAGPAGQYTKLLVVNPTGLQGITVALVPLPARTIVDSAEAAKLESDVLARLRSSPAFGATAGPVTTIGGHPSFEVTLTFETKVQDQTLSDQYQYYLLSPHGLYALDILGTSTSVTDQILHSFKITR